MTTRLQCVVEGCNSSIEVYEAVSTQCTYVCPRCLLVDPSEAPKFQEFAFDEDLNRSLDYGNLTGASRRRKRGIVELKVFVEVITQNTLSSKGGVGFQIHNIRREDRAVPEWAVTNEGIQKILLTAFPRLQTNPLQRKRAGRWAQVIQLHFRQGWTYSEVADELNEKPRSIEMVIRGIIRTSQGQRSDGRGPRKVSTP